MVDTRTALEAHAHEWQLDDDGGWACTQCGQTSATCVVTRGGETHPTGNSLLICDPCAKQVAGVLVDIRSALELWQPTPVPVLRATRYDRELVHGTGSSDRLPFGIELGDEQHRGILDPDDVVDIIWGWVEMWQEASGSVQEVPPLDYLRGHIMWAVHNPEASAWEDWVREMRTLRHHARRLAGLLPKREHGPCIHCGGQVVRDWADEQWRPNVDGLSDVARCTGCGMTWGDRTTWGFAQRHTIRLMPHVDPEMLVTLEEARAIYPQVPADTIRKWMQRDREAGERGEERAMPERSWTERGAPTYRLGDIDALVTRREDDTRRGRRAVI